MSTDAICLQKYSFHNKMKVGQCAFGYILWLLSMLTYITAI